MTKRPLLAFAVLGTVLLHGCSHDAAVWGGDGSPVALAADSPETLGEVRDFTLTERSGRDVSKADLAGKVWIGSFVFTRCTGPCPSITATMRKLQDELAGTQARLVTFSVDPDFDTPEVLARYAGNFGASAERWWMLTGSQAMIDGVVPPLLPPNQRDETVPVGQRVGHNTRLMVVDQHGRIRGLYSGESQEHVQRIVARVRFLEQHP